MRRGEGLAASKGGVRETSVLFCLNSYSFKLSVCDSSGIKLICERPSSLPPEDLRGREADEVLVCGGGGGLRAIAQGRAACGPGPTKD